MTSMNLHVWVTIGDQRLFVEGYLKNGRVSIISAEDVDGNPVEINIDNEDTIMDELEIKADSI